jgi:sulfite reductase (NADPH) flavoprotein alpha-component
VRVHPRLDCDLDFAKPAAQWIEAALTAFAPKGVITVPAEVKTDAVVSTDVVTATVVDHINLNSSRSDKETIHLALQFDAVPAYEPGDSLEIFAENDPALVEEVLNAVSLPVSAPLMQSLKLERDLTTLSLKTLESYAQITGDSAVEALRARSDIKEWLNGRQLIDVLLEFPHALTIDQLHALTRPLSPRAYSIASSRRETEDEAHLLVAAVRYSTHGRPRLGVASGYIADRLKKGATVRARLKPNRHFRLPTPDKDILMVGPGTGVAPFRAFVQERRAQEAPGRSWLFFGDRRYTHDFLYQLEWQDALKDGALTRIDVAFSRDAPQKVYVQDRLYERRADVIAWLEGGAYFYVCGDAKNMAKDVRATLVRAFEDVKGLSALDAEVAVTKLERDKRYLQDVY